MTDKHLISTLEQLTSLYKPPGHTALNKENDRLDANCKTFIANSPFLVVASWGLDGRTDASPRGDKPGFAHTPDANTVLIPDRLGNNRLDSLRNIVETGQIGLIFFVPGSRETLRINGTAEITADPVLLDRFSVNGKPPRTLIRVRVVQAYLQCGKALIRSGLWDRENVKLAANLPPAGKMLADHVATIGEQEGTKIFEHAYRTRLY